METVLSLFIFHDAYVVSVLVGAIMIIILLLLMYNFKSPESIVMNEVHSNENIEGALRRVLGEQSWVGAPGTGDEEGSAEALKKLGVLEQEMLKKDKEIADLHKQLTQGAGAGGAEADAGNQAELMEKIDELEARLQEYEIIEDDIADLSLYKAENEKLKSELDTLKQDGTQPEAEEEPAPEAVAPEPAEAVPEPAEPEEPVEEAVVEIKEDAEVATAPVTQWTESEDSEESGRDLVAEFEKVVNNKDAILGEGVDASNFSQSPEDDGEVIVKETKAEAKMEEVKVDAPKMEVVHPKLKDVKPDSKEEAEVFIADLKALKKGS